MSRVIVVVGDRVKSAERVLVLHLLRPLWCLSGRPSTLAVTEEASKPFDVLLPNLAAAQSRVAERTRTIETSLRDVEAFNATVSHDLRAPLSVIRLSCRVISQGKDDDLPPRVVESLARIQRSVSYMTELVDDLLALAHVSNAPLERSAIDLSRLCDEIVSNLRFTSPERKATVDIAPGLRCSGDVSLMRAAMENLIGNAWKYSSRVPHPRIATGTADVDGRAAFFIRDNGAGFDMKEAHRLFAPFEGLHASNEFEGHGRGPRGREGHHAAPRRTHLGPERARSGRDVLLRDSLNRPAGAHPRAPRMRPS